MMLTTFRQSRILGVVWSSFGRATVSSNFSSSTSSETKDKGAIKKSVFISQSHDVFTNLALEDWIYKNYDFSNHHVLMLWINDPCVVIGRHQNPFNESNVSQLEAAGIELARRNSGGGTVYHDRNNLNCTFFTPRERYDRKYNLGLMTRAIYREYGIDTEISDRDDILLQGKKVSVQNFKCFRRKYRSLDSLMATKFIKLHAKKCFHFLLLLLVARYETRRIWW